jgi:hypothetical protein
VGRCAIVIRRNRQFEIVFLTERESYHHELRAAMSYRPPPLGQTGQRSPALIPFDSWHDGFYNQINRADSFEEAYRMPWLGIFFRRCLRRYLSRVTYFNKLADRICRSLPLWPEGVMIHGRS